MRTILLLFVFSSFAFVSCSSGARKKGIRIDSPVEILTAENSVEKDLTSYGLPLKLNFPNDDSELGTYKIQVQNELDGFIWYLKKGNDFQFQIEELGEDTSFYNDRIDALTDIPYFSDAELLKTKDYIVFHINAGANDEAYLIYRKIIAKKTVYMASTPVAGVKPKLYTKMLQTILSIRAR